MLRIEIDALFNQLSDKDSKVRKEAKKTLYELEQEGAIPMEILVQYIDDDNIMVKMHIIDAISRLKHIDKKKVLEKAFLETEDFLLLSSFLESFLKIKEFSFEDSVLQKYELLEKRTKKEKNSVKKKQLQLVNNSYTVEMLKYLQNFGSKKAHKLLFQLLERKNRAIGFHSLYALSKTNAQIPLSLLQKLAKKSSGTLKQLALALLEKR
jgi:HEAT repeat protein